MGNLHGVVGAPRGRLIRQAAATAAGLSLLFLVVYGGTSWITSLRTDVGTCRFGWERFIPFVPLMVIPYMSIDLFFVAAPFLAADRRELTVFRRRVAMAILVAGACFLAVPLRLDVERPQLEGWLGVLFGWFFAADRPYNLCPSLHIALRTLLAEIYVRHARGPSKAITHLWFFLVGLSTLLTYQHHVIDVLSGFVLAAVCFYAIPAVERRQPLAPNRRVGAYYATGAVAFCIAGALARPWGLLLLWPAVCCTIAAAGCLKFGPDIYRKTDGRLPTSTRLALAPLLIGQTLSLWHYRRRCRAWDKATPNVWIGRKLSNSEAVEAVNRGVTAVLDLTAEFAEAEPFLAVRYLNVPILDLTAPTPEQLGRCLAFLSENATDGIVYVHCKIGYSRSAAVVGAFLMASGRAASAEATVARLRKIRPSVVIRPEVAMMLDQFEKSLNRRRDGIEMERNSSAVPLPLPTSPGLLA